MIKGTFARTDHPELREGMTALLQEKDGGYVAQFDSHYLPTFPATHNTYAFGWHKFEKEDFKDVEKSLIEEGNYD